jgi:RNA polymerase sigma factor (TIGR02999 family)
MNEPDVAAKRDHAPHEAGAVDALFVEVYDRLKAMASRRRGPGDTLDTTALVHELYLRVGERGQLAEMEQARFLGYAARAMRNLLIDRARDRIGRAGGGWIVTTLADDDRRLAVESAEDALALETALAKLEVVDARAARVVELRYFAGLSLEQTAQLLDLARRTVDRDWHFARAFLHAELG